MIVALGAALIALAISMLANILLVEKLEKANERLEAMENERKW